jgi:hypothetical protein
VKASSPDEQPALQIRIGSSLPLVARIAGMMSRSTVVHASVSRKNEVMLMRTVSNRWVNSAGWTSS